MLIVGDLHFSETSSLLPRGEGEDTSIRLQNMIDTLNWVTSIQQEGEKVVQLGDFFDKKTLTGNELLTVRVLTNKLNGKLSSWEVLVGNHGIDTVGDSTYALPSTVYGKPSAHISVNKQNVYLFFPYLSERNRKPLKEYIDEYIPMEWKNKKIIIFSHNNILGQVPGGAGFTPKEIEDNCSLFINGHLHKRAWISKKILNAGNVTGQNFSEDAAFGVPGIWRLDEDTLELVFIENPYALLYTHWDFTEINEEDIPNLESSLPKNRTLVAVTTYSDRWQKLKPFVEGNTLKYKLILKYRDTKVKNKLGEVLDCDITPTRSTNHIEKFIAAVKQKFGDSQVLEELK